MAELTMLLKLLGTSTITRTFMLSTFGLFSLLPISNITFLTPPDSSDFLGNFKGFLFDQGSIISPAESQMVFSYMLAEWYPQMLLPRGFGEYIRNHNISLESLSNLSNAYYKSVIYRINMDGRVSPNDIGVYSVFSIGGLGQDIFGRQAPMFINILDRMSNTFMVVQGFSLIVAVVKGICLTNKNFASLILENDFIQKMSLFDSGISVIMKTIMQRQSSISAAANLAAFTKQRELIQGGILSKTREVTNSLILNFFNRMSFRKEFIVKPPRMKDGLRNIPMHPEDAKIILKIISSFYFRKKQVQNLKKKKKRANAQGKKFINKNLDNIKFPTVFISGYRRNEVAKTMIGVINNFFGVNYINLNPSRIKEALSATMESDDGQVANWLIWILKIVKAKRRVHKLLWLTNEMSQMDLFVLYDTEDLLKTRFNVHNSDFFQHRALNLFLNYLSNTYKASFLFTINKKSMKFDIDLAIPRRMNYVLDIRKPKNHLEHKILKNLLFFHYQYGLFSNIDMPIEEFLTWFYQTVYRNTKLVQLLPELFINIRELAVHFQKKTKKILLINEDILDKLVENWNRDP